ncbi:MAG: hypothetical protein Q8880_07945 [Bacteroidota bacterium]|nr:hypothetical protein [Bacteroidota bacterium]
MRSNVLIVLLLILPVILKSQNAKNISTLPVVNKNNSIGISVGECLSTGDFAIDNVYSEKAGLAGNGLSINAIYKHYYPSNLGIAIKGYFNFNEFKSEKLCEMLSSALNYSFISSEGKYSSYGLLIGPMLKVPIDKLSLNFHVLFGFGGLTEPEITFTVLSGNNFGWLKMSEINSNAFVFNPGGGLLYTVNDNWDIFAYIDYLEGSFEFGNYVLSNSAGQNENIARGTQKYQAFTLSTGLALKF